MNNSAQQSSYQLPDLMFDDFFGAPDMQLNRPDFQDADTDMLLAEELLSDLVPRH